MNWQPLDKSASDLYRGIAILLIVTHNFMHLFPVPRENEFAFAPGGFTGLLTFLGNEPENVIRAVLAYFGHFGVQIFIFLSAYGLTKKYSVQPFRYWPFIRDRVVKIYPSFILAILLWAVILGLPSGWSGPFDLLWTNRLELMLKLSLAANFIPNQGLSVVGPWWFISFIFQFYLIFPALLRFYEHCKGWGLLFLSAVSIALTARLQGHIGEVNLYLTVLGHLPEFCLGLYVARNDASGLQFSRLWVLLALLVFLLGNIRIVFWYAQHTSFLVVLLAVLHWASRDFGQFDTVKRVLLFFGALSMPLFLVNGFLRNPYVTWAVGYDHWLLTLGFCLMHLSVSVIVALALSNWERRVMLMANRRYREN